MKGLFNLFVNIYLQNGILNEQLKNSTLVDISLNVLTVKHTSLHNNHLTNFNANLVYVVRHFILVLLLPVKYLFKKYVTNDANYNKFDYLILVPNEKFRRNLQIVKAKLKGTYKVISIADIQGENCLNIKRYNRNRLKTSVRLFLILIAYSLVSLKSKAEIRKLVNNLDLVQKLIYNMLVLNDFFGQYKFIKYFSLLPNMDHHKIIETYFHDKFVRTYGIRTTTTSAVDEHRFIKTDVLFYKSISEKTIYENLLNDKQIELKPASLLIDLRKEDQRLVYPKQPHNVVFIDTCLMKYEQYNLGRSNAIEDFYDIIKNYDEIKILHKFHPGLQGTARMITMNMIKNNVYLTDDYNSDYLLNADLIIGFYSTVFQEAILRKIPIVMLEYDYGFSEKKNRFMNYDLENSPMIRVNYKVELEIILNRIFCSSEPYPDILCTQLLYNYYTSLYNYPEGIAQMFKILEA